MHDKQISTKDAPSRVATLLTQNPQIHEQIMQGSLEIEPMNFALIPCKVYIDREGGSQKE